jgi:two-component system, cell cycle sensor histidine kinase PleC
MAVQARSVFGRALDGALMFSDAFRASLSPRTREEADIVDYQLSMAREGARTGLAIFPLAITLISAAALAWFPIWRVAIWPALMVLVSGASGVFYEWLLKRDDHSIASIARRAKAFCIGSLAQNIALGSVALLLWAPHSSANHVFMFVLLCCALSGWASIGTFHLATGVTSLPVYLVILLLGPVLGGNFIAAGIIVAFWMVMAGLFRTNYITRSRMMRLELERGEMIENLKTAKAESDDARHRAETASQAKSAFLANMSHELRTPLNAILGFSEIIATKAMGPAAMDQYSEYGGYIHGSGEHLLSLINDILDLAKIEAGRLVLRETDVDIRLLMDDVIKMMSTKAVASGISLAVHVDRSFPNVHCDERSVRQMLVNLASNAIKFTPPGGRVTAFANTLPDGSLSFGIDDTGVGIAPEDQDKVFESFGQGRHDAILGEKGTGLGLPIVRGLAQAHGGQIMLNSVPREGTRVTIIFPAERARSRLKAVS